MLPCARAQAATLFGPTSRFQALSHPENVVRLEVGVLELAPRRFDTAREHRLEHATALAIVALIIEPVQRGTLPGNEPGDQIRHDRQARGTVRERHNGCAFPDRADRE
jgi:hypothetical protein